MGAALRLISSFVLGNWQRLVIYGLVVLGMLGSAAALGYHRGVLKLYDYQAKQAIEAVKILTKIEKVKEIIRVPYVKRETVIQTVFQTIEKETENATSRPACNATRGWVRRHNAAADSEDPGQPGSMDDEADTGIRETEAEAVVIRNYKAFHQVANDLKACRAFVQQVERVTDN